MSFFPTGGPVPLVLRPGEDTGGAYTVLQVASPPAGGPPLHCHQREDEALYVLEGEYEVQCGAQTVRAPAGAFIFAPRGIPHAFRNVSAGPSQILIIASPAGIEKFFEEVSAFAQAGPPDLAQLKAIAARYDIDLMLPEAAS